MNDTQNVSKANKLPVAPTIVAAYRHLFHHRQQFMHLAGLPAIILVAVWTLFDWASMAVPAQDPGNDAGYLANLVFAWFSLRWHILFLTKRPLGAGWIRTWRFIISAVFFMFLGALLMALPAGILLVALLPSVQ